MCARYTLSAAEKEILAAYAAEIIDPFKPDTNIAPTDGGLVITADKPDIIQNYQFGLVPWFATSASTAFKNVNARTDKLLSSNQWKPLMEKNKRCLVLADGFYEWQNVNGEKLPWRFTVTDRDVFAFAGLYSRWKHPKTNEEYWSFSIITTASQPGTFINTFHERMPVILPKAHEQLWLSNDVSPTELVEICDEQYPAEFVNHYRVSKAVNVTRGGNNKGPELILPENSL